jgi:hypothetical protein
LPVSLPDRPRRAEASAFPIVGNTGHGDVLLQIPVEIVVGGHLVLLATLLVGPHPAPPPLHKKVLYLHRDRRPHPGEGVDHQGGDKENRVFAPSRTEEVAMKLVTRECREPMLTLLKLWRIALFVAKNDKDWRNRYLARLKQAISDNGPSLSSVANEVLDIDHSLSSEHLNIVLRHVVHMTFDDHNLYPRLAQWLSTPEAKGHLDEASNSVDAVLAELDLQPWNVDESHPKDAGAYLMFPLLRWQLAGATDIVSRRVFLRGLKMAMLPPRSSDRQLSGLPNRFVGIEDVAPLIATVDRALLEETIRYGLTLDDQGLRAICRLFVFDIPVDYLEA